MFIYNHKYIISIYILVRYNFCLQIKILCKTIESFKNGLKKDLQN